MPVIPWKMAEAPVAGDRYLALISYLPLKHFRAIPNFLRFTSEIRRQLRTASGLIGYSLDARPFARTFWTLSVWRDQQSLTDFVNQAPHNRIMQKLAPHLGKSQFAQWQVEAGGIPLDWRSAKARITQS
jgi:hypothetical protein